MDRRAQLVNALRSIQKDAPIQIWPAIVKSIQGTNCTVDIVGTDLTDIDEVNLRADDEATEGYLIIPRIGSYVYVAAIENAIDNLFVCMFSEVDEVKLLIDDEQNPLEFAVEKAKLSFKLGEQTLLLDKEGLDYERDKIKIKATTDELSLTHDKASLKADSSGLSVGMGKSSLKLTDGGVNISTGGSQVVMQGGLVSVGNPDAQMKDILLAIVGVLNVLTVEVPNLPSPAQGGPPTVMSIGLNTASELAVEALNQLVIKLMA